MHSSSLASKARLTAILQHVSPHCTFDPCSSNASSDKFEQSVIRIEPKVRRALSTGSPVVALESTIISHGMPYPQNLQTAKEVEAIVTQHGAIPATIAILGGVPCIGLTEEELETLAHLGTKALKTARRDIPTVTTKGEFGATTVSATMFFAAKVGIRIFVTGGIGGVHRLGEITMDISSDLTELGRTPVAVVCAGVKSILDIPRTLEYLETQGVTVVAFGTEEFPAFYSPKSGCKAPSRADSPEECAAIIDASFRYDMQTGVLIGVPIPEEHAAAAQVVESAIQTAIQEAICQKITGNAVTPFMLKRVAELTGGASLTSNIMLIKNNARIGAQISVALSRKLSRVTQG
ncbi:hypothetical protein O6H91_07G111600 [Diphasiastrum complanatum]|uniref:Uncharacterized protein n=4 Tax=Diphasiastrum complanatum TaxID=34168 RepID=A0ACC2D8Q7_DIPCM|nr:hypothetical protein O6H91_07G111600 [Diphasiastrum complanatum]KAJ7550663.1 hypothetical protein O6H91_07G111600 [Diphasiastrum complanatum]KAJ7550664.1 hypothetical protein O6H91_07G111600 [Diphasiastrum complanatum]